MRYALLTHDRRATARPAAGSVASAGVSLAMTPLRQRMLEDLGRYNYAPRTRQTYVAQIARLAKHFGVSPDRLTREQVQEYQDLLGQPGRQLAAAGSGRHAVPL